MAESVCSVTPDPHSIFRRRSPPRGEHFQAPPPAQSPSTPERPSPASPREQRGTCFTCQQEGHWSRDCPLRGGVAGGGRTPGRGRRVAAPGGGEFPEVQCPCGAGACVVLASKTEKNPGRLFYRCPVLPLEEKCGFFQWCDMGSPITKDVVNNIQQREHDVDDHPKCPCGAGWCIVLAMEDGEHVGRKYFACPVKKGKKCGYFRWHDMPSSPLHSVGKLPQKHMTSPVQHYIGYPMCSCGAGRCRLLTMEGGEYAGQKYFTCAIKKGQGACNFFKWYDNMGEDHETNGKPPGTVFDSMERVTKLAENKANERNLVNNEDELLHERSDEKVLPSPLSVETHQFKGGDQSYQLSPIKRLSLNEGRQGGVGSRPGKCFKCGGEGHWMKDCVGSLPSTCYRCGKVGHWSKDCTA